MLDEVSLSGHQIVAGALWMVGGLLVVVGAFNVAELGQLGLLIAGAGGVMSIRNMLRQNSARERRAFRMGQESVGADGSETLRSVR